MSRKFSWIRPELPRGLASDLYDSARRLLRQPGFAFATIATLALGIGANVAVFLVADTVLFQSGPLSQPDRIVVLEHAYGAFDRDRSKRTAPDLLDWEQLGDVFESVASYAPGAANLQSADGAERIKITLATPSFFSVLGVAPSAGRAFLPDDRVPHHGNVVVISDGLWRRDFGDAAGTIGSVIQLSGESYSVVGIMPRDFHFPGETEAWIPLTVPFDPSQVKFLKIALLETLIGRLRSGLRSQQAQHRVDLLTAQLGGPNPDPREDPRVVVTALRSSLSKDRLDSLRLLATMAALLLLIATANVTSLLLARASSRLDEMRVRIALGGTPARIRAQLMAEPLVLSLFGGLAGLVIALICARGLVASGVVEHSDLGDVQLGVRAYAITLGISLFSGLVAGAIAAGILRRQAQGAPGAARAGLSRVGLRTRQVVLTAQVALCFVLLTGAVLVIQSLSRLLDQDRVLPASTITAEISLSPEKYPTQALRAAFANDVLARIRRAPGVTSAGLVSNLPLGGQASIMISAQISGSTVPAADLQNLFADLEPISPGYFQTMGIALVRGRNFDERDGLGAPLVAIISDAMAARYWPGADPLGATVSVGGEPRTIVGIVRTIHSFSLRSKPVPQVYYPYAQQSSEYLSIVVRTWNGATNVPAVIRESVHALDNTAPVFRIRSFGQVRIESVAPERDRAIILGAFGLLAIALSAIGIFGAASYNVARRASEIGIRRALGAPNGAVAGLVLRQSLVPVSGGLALGAVLALAVNRLLASVLFGIGPDDPATLVAVAAGLLVVGLIATVAPAARAMRIDPLDAIRAE